MIFTLALSFGVFAQESTSSRNTDEVFINRTQSPEFPGGEEAVYEFLKANLQFPENRDTAGTIFVAFVIEANGEVTNVRVLRGLAPELDAEAVRVVSLMPKWIPGKQFKISSNEWVPVRVQFNVPVRVPQPLDNAESSRNDTTTPHEKMLRVLEGRTAGATVNSDVRISCRPCPDRPPPLVIVDGIEVEFESINSINPNQIESITVLRDSVAVAQFGERAIYGVIEIRTKQDQ